MIRHSRSSGREDLKWPTRVRASIGSNAVIAALDKASVVVVGVENRLGRAVNVRAGLAARAESGVGQDLAPVS